MPVLELGPGSKVPKADCPTGMYMGWSRDEREVLKKFEMKHGSGRYPVYKRYLRNTKQQDREMLEKNHT